MKQCNPNRQEGELMILVTGGAGYIGSHFVKQAVKVDEVLVLDNLSTGHQQAIDPAAIFIKGDVRNVSLLNHLMTFYPINSVVHFAGKSSEAEIEYFPHIYYGENVQGMITLLNAMHQHRIRTILFSSTATVYGNNYVRPFDEFDAVNPLTVYSKSKYFMEQIAADYSNSYGMNSIAFRYFHASGAHPSGDIGECHVQETHVLPLLLKHLLGETSSFTVYGNNYETPDGTCIRDFIHVEDIANAHLLALQLVRSETGYSEIFNLSSGRGHSVKELITLSEQMTGRQSMIQYVDRQVGDPAILIANSKKARMLLDWAPFYTIEDIIETAWAWHSEKEKEFLRDSAIWSKR